MNYIQGEKFIELADNDIIYYCPTNEVDSFFLDINPKQKFILISHNSDGAIHRKKIRYDGASLENAPTTLVKWFGQNVCVADERMESLPIGLENSKWFPEIKKLQKIQSILNKPKTVKNLVYANFNIETNPLERTDAYKVAQSIKYATTTFGRNGYNFDEYLEDIYNHEFVLCPPGNGEDTHRFWESLYVGSIPVVKKTINSSYYSDLPVCFIEDWEQITDLNFLLNQKKKLREKNNLEMLNFDYWKNKILTTANKIKNSL